MASARLIGELTMLTVLASGMWRAQLLAELFETGGKLAIPANDNTIRS
jgi:PST family polysaccharide transporter